VRGFYEFVHSAFPDLHFLVTGEFDVPGCSLREQRGGCVVARTTFHDGMDPGWQDEQTSFVTLLPLSQQHDPGHYNQTKWVLANMLAPAADGGPPHVQLCATAPIQSSS